MTRYFSISFVKRNITRAYPILAAGVTQVFAVVTFMLSARWLSQEELGSWVMFLTLASFIEMARLGLVQSAMVHFTAHSTPEDRPVLWLATLLVGIGASIVGAVVLGVFGFVFNQFWHLPNLEGLLFLFPFVALLTAPLRWHDAARTSVQDFQGIFWAAMYYGIAYLVLLFIVKYFFLQVTLLALLWLQIPAALFTLFLRRKTILSDLSFQNVHFPSMSMLRFWFKKVWNFGRFGLGSNLFSMFFQRADVLLLGAFVTPAGFAAYNVATRIATWLDFPLNALSQAFFPKIAAENHRNGVTGVGKMYRKSVKTLLLFAIPMSVVAFVAAVFFVRILAGDGYPTAPDLLRILLVANLAKPFGRMLGVVLDATGEPASNFKMIVLSLAINLVLLICLLPRFGALGAAVASTLGIFITTIAGQWFFKTRKLWSLSSQ